MFPSHKMFMKAKYFTTFGSKTIIPDCPVQQREIRNRPAAKSIRMKNTYVKLFYRDSSFTKIK
jgi:hypothetical protein